MKMPHPAQNSTISRRRFLATSGALAAGAFLASEQSWAALPDEQKYKKAVKIGMVQVDGTLSEKFALLKRLGFDGIEMDSPNDLRLEDVLRAREESGLTIHGVVDSRHWNDDYRLSHPDAEVRARGVEALQTALRDSKAYGGTSVLLVPGRVGPDGTYEQAWERSQAEIRKAIPLAEELEIHILLENVWNDFLTDPAETAKYIDQLDSKWVGAYYDVGNSLRYAPPTEWINALKHRIIKLDIKEYSLSKAKEEGAYAGFDVKLLEGDCNWPQVMRALESIGFSGWGTAEIPGGGEERLAEIAQRMDRIFAS
ncbi:MAG: sugar phosphate isomerase/epimerase family protein [Pirellulales bacterium]